MKTDLTYIKKLIKILDASDLSEIEIEEEGTRLKVVKNRPVQHEAPQYIQYAPAQIPSALPQTVPTAEAKTAESTKAAEEKKLEKTNLVEIHSPIVGTFYRAPSPTADPYVQVGQIIQVGTVLCIIEAMKLMNEIESEVNGKIVKILVENSKPVEYNQVLFLVEPS